MSERVRGPLMWVAAEDGEILTPDAMTALIESGKATVVRRTDDTITIGRRWRLDATFHVAREADYV